MTSQRDDSEKLRQLRRQLDGEDVRDAARTRLDPGEQLRELGEVGLGYGDVGPVSEWTPVEVLLAKRELFAGPPRFTPVLAVGPQEIATARPRPRGLLRRRVELGFADGSRIVLALPAFRSPAPQRLLAALPASR